jgi:hypothetical protein
MARIPSDPPDDELTPRQLHDRVDEVVNLTVDELEAFRASEYNQEYLEANSDRAQPGNEPLDDVITLLETPPDEWRDVEDGFNEIAEARELLDFQRRTQGQIKSQGLGSSTIAEYDDMTFREAASIRWGIDPDDDREWL